MISSKYSSNPVSFGFWAIGFIKDIAAGAVMFAAMAAMAIGLLIYVPKFL